jgi:hypothetical protein
MVRVVDKRLARRSGVIIKSEKRVIDHMMY